MPPKKLMSSSAFAATGPTTDVALSVSNCGASGANNIVAADPVNRQRLLSAAIIPAGNVTLTIESGTDVLTGPMALVSGTLYLLPLNEDGWVTTAGNKALNFNLSGNVTLTGVAKVQAIN